eukprot:CAMPEP_0116955602 /NCGR_PEP_ID=MMETSP0467-20121206/42732_1 /TAXON_ID=283647 /ORGANISM="Mesodinium pulex, Strain SPMC105" /LENGTH=59 /DNA_ID=CAMNT_0004641709 /DNA_START=1023 /DNA_END=1202 /DNA_ORIENTATION=-
MASFFEPQGDLVMRVPECKLEQWDQMVDLIPSLKSRFTDGMTFQQFNDNTFKAYLALNE